MPQGSPPSSDQPQDARHIQAALLTPEAFAPYGHVACPGRGDVKMIRGGHVRLSKSDSTLAHHPDATDIKLDFYDVTPEKSVLTANIIERHILSAQMFSPMNARRWLVVVWPDGPESSPKAFVAGPHDVVTYAPGLWHHGIVALDQPTSFTSIMWKKGDPAVDTEFLTLDTSWTISWPNPDTQEHAE